MCDAQAAGKNFRVIVVDSRPKLEGKEQCRRLIKHGIKCSYVLMNSISYMMKEVCIKPRKKGLSHNCVKSDFICSIALLDQLILHPFFFSCQKNLFGCYEISDLGLLITIMYH